MKKGVNVYVYLLAKNSNPIDSIGPAATLFK